jgi:hypothetical protein
MRIPNPRLIRLAGLTKGAIVEGGDSELIVTPVLQPIIELSSPIDRVFTAAQVGGTADDSILIEARSKLTGIQAAATADILTFSRGLWILELGGVFIFNSTTTQNSDSSYLAIVDLGGNICNLIEFPHQNIGAAGAGVQWTLARRVQLNFQRDGFILRFRQGAMVAAGDILAVTFSINALRLL